MLHPARYVEPTAGPPSHMGLTVPSLATSTATLPNATYQSPKLLERQWPFLPALRPVLTSAGPAPAPLPPQCHKCASWHSCYPFSQHDACATGNEDWVPTGQWHRMHAPLHWGASPLLCIAIRQGSLSKNACLGCIHRARQHLPSRWPTKTASDSASTTLSYLAM